MLTCLDEIDDVTYRTNAELVLGNGRVVASGVVAASSGLDLAVARSPAVGRSVLCEGSLVCLAARRGASAV